MAIAFDRDTRILSSLVSRARQSAELDVSTQNRVIRSAFEGLVAVVPHYRTMALYGREGSTAVTAVDPAEKQDTVAEERSLLLPACRARRQRGGDRCRQ